MRFGQPQAEVGWNADRFQGMPEGEVAIRAQTYAVATCLIGGCRRAGDTRRLVSSSSVAARFWTTEECLLFTMNTKLAVEFN